MLFPAQPLQSSPAGRRPVVFAQQSANSLHHSATTKDAVTLYAEISPEVRASEGSDCCQPWPRPNTTVILHSSIADRAGFNPTRPQPSAYPDITPPPPPVKITKPRTGVGTRQSVGIAPPPPPRQRRPEDQEQEPQISLYDNLDYQAASLAHLAGPTPDAATESSQYDNIDFNSNIPDKYRSVPLPPRT